MGKKKKKSEDQKPWCFYCDRIFDDEATLIQHQKAKHFKCPECNRKLNTAQGLTVHSYQVHHVSMTAVPGAKPGRESVDVEVFGMAGVPDGMKPGGVIDNAPPSKKPKPEPSVNVAPPPLAAAPYTTAPPLQPPSLQTPAYPSQPPMLTPPLYAQQRPIGMAGPPPALYNPGGPMPPVQYGGMPSFPPPGHVPMQGMPPGGPLMPPPGMPPLGPPMGMHPSMMRPGMMGPPPGHMPGPNQGMGPPPQGMGPPPQMNPSGPLFPLGPSHSSGGPPMGGAPPLFPVGGGMPPQGVPPGLAPSTGPAAEAVVVWQDEDYSIEERRAQLPRYQPPAWMGNGGSSVYT